MATRNFAYDHPAYRVPVGVCMPANAAGASAVSRFVAHADMLAKQIVSRILTAGTSTTSAAATVYRVSGTTTTSIGAVTLAVLTVNGFSENALSDAVITKGDEVRITNGTDATVVMAHAFEGVVTPGANFTV